MIYSVIPTSTEYDSDLIIRLNAKAKKSFLFPVSDFIATETESPGWLVWFFTFF